MCEGEVPQWRRKRVTTNGRKNGSDKKFMGVRGVREACLVSKKKERFK